MKFGPVPVENADGALLAHALALPEGRLKKGHRLTGDDIDSLRAQNIESVIVARLEPTDVEENEAARRIASGLLGAELELGEAFTGRVNLYSKVAGIFQASKELVDALNRISPAITLATLDDGVFVEAGRMVATVKIIPFAVSAATLAVAEVMVGKNTVLAVVPSMPHRIGLIATQLPSLKVSTMDKTARVLSNRLAAAGSVLHCETRVAHSIEAVAAAITSIKTDCDMLIIFGASAITDEDDVIPAAIRERGGVVHHFGMPVDPGNLLLSGEVDGIPVIGAPGCARSPAENGFDWVLQRLLAGLSVDDDYITGLGVGGLLMEITARPQPREG